MGGISVLLEYEKPVIEIITFYSREPLAEEGEGGGPSDVDEGFERFPED